MRQSTGPVSRSDVVSLPSADAGSARNAESWLAPAVDGTRRESSSSGFASAVYRVVQQADRSRGTFRPDIYHSPERLEHDGFGIELHQE